MPIKSVKMKISKNKKCVFFLMSQGSLNSKIKFLGQKMCSVARGRTDRHTHTHGSEYRLDQRTTFQGVHEFSIHPIIKDWSNKGRCEKYNIQTHFYQLRLLAKDVHQDPEIKQNILINFQIYLHFTSRPFNDTQSRNIDVSS